jgi:hypothetical protein
MKAQTFTKPVSFNETKAQVDALLLEQDRAATRERAFGHLPVKEHKSEWYVQKTVCKYLREKYPTVRFYSTLDGFDLGKQRSLLSALQWFEAGVPDLFIFARNADGDRNMLVIELKREGKKVGKDEHTKRQQGWLTYLVDNCGAYAVFGCGVEEAKHIIDLYFTKSKQYGKAKTRRA